ncbi:molybdenum ABC transporter ATP-binding protein [Falsigemmobacter intermedius]|uniref:Molybdenum ABC transporter ATP-binding protein n=1 Tax=Falsigemmobacter intermedius TaxID=1553448 RepID=A0A444MA91_9RHOB|nr:molybdenum ABC transporter ATP-binding protein [Falsigemmobacter intermedius]RWY40081.1 molybdenum ABC transporter ATP-binding protein [Falsigemmobacter intermedius]
MTLEVDIRHSFGAFHLEAAFSAPAGVTALFGPSGSGKSTIFQAIAGLLQPDAGHIRLAGKALFDRSAGVHIAPRHRRMGCVFQEPRLFPHLSVAQNLRYGAGRAPAAEAERVCDMLGITHLLSRRPGALSGGEQQRVAIGRALLSQPDFLLMDEPLSALDAARRGEILPWLERLRDEAGLPILYISHSLEEVARLATTLVLMKEGKVTGAGPLGEVLSGASPGLSLDRAAAVLQVQVTGRSADGLNKLRLAEGTPLWLPGAPLAEGRQMRLQIPARDVMIARELPQGISALNVLPARILNLTPISEAEVMVRMATGGGVIPARITARSAAALDLRPGGQVFAIVKAASLLSGD